MPQPPDRITLGPIDRTHITLYGVIEEVPTYAFPLETRTRLSRPIGTNVNAYYQSPVWDWAGQLLCKA